MNTPRGCRSLLVERGPGESAREPKNRLGAIDATDFDQVGFEARFLSLETQPLALSELDRSLLQNCMAGDQQAWRQFCDRFASLILDVAEDTLRFANLSESQPQVSPEDLVAEFFRQLRLNQFQLLQNFRGESSLATYLAVSARRCILNELALAKK